MIFPSPFHSLIFFPNKLKELYTVHPCTICNYPELNAIYAQSNFSVDASNKSLAEQSKTKIESLNSTQDNLGEKKTKYFLY